MESDEQLLLANKAWVRERLRVRRDFFSRHVLAQRPEFLWVGCSDSRVPAEEITGAGPGELFVHRNVANLVVTTDLNFLAVLQYAVEVLMVKHIIVCGHYNCGGVRSAMNALDSGLVSKWLSGVKDVYRVHQHQIESLTDPEERWDRLVEINVTEQLWNLAKTPILLRTSQQNYPTLHGWVYDVRTGYLKQIAKLLPSTPVEEELHAGQRG